MHDELRDLTQGEQERVIVAGSELVHGVRVLPLGKGMWIIWMPSML